MKVLDLQCRHGHVFEGWFASEDDFQNQRGQGLVQCPLCADSQVEKRLSAPRLNLGAREQPSPAAGKPANAEAMRNASGALATVQPGTTGMGVLGDASSLPPALQAAWLQLARKIVANTEDVGARFAQEARRMHHGEVEERAIRGQATPDEAVQLIEEGIAVMPLPLPVAAKETLQ